MDPTKVESADDILAAADARLNAPVEPVTTHRGPGKPAAQEPEAEEPAGEEPSGEEAEPDAEPEFSVDGERYTPAQIRKLKADAQRATSDEQQRLAAEYMLAHPEEYARLRRERGLDRGEPPATQPDRSAEPAGPDPVEDARGWKYERFNQYVEYLTRQGKTATPEAISAQVEQDLVAARTERMHELLIEERAERKREREETERARGQWRQQQEANAIARTLQPLFTKYPQAATPEGQEDVEARIIRAVHLGQPVNYEAIVKTVHDRNAGAVRTWANNKKALAAGTAPAAGRGGAAQGSRAKLVDRMPADISSIGEYAERVSRGES